MEGKTLIQQPHNKSPEKVTYQDDNVLVAAKKRLGRVLDEYDHVWIAYSGGKDSQVVLDLMEIVKEERGDTTPINVLFRDEELIPDPVIEEVQRRAETGKYNFNYYCLEMKIGKFLMGKSESYVAWDKKREWMRQPPEYAITDIGVDTKDLEQYDFDELFMQGLEGSKIILTGVRADESLLRFASCCRKAVDNWIVNPKKKSTNISMGKVVFDWTELDIFKFFHDFDKPYCSIYDSQLWGGVPLRVATPLHENASAQLPKLKTMFPTFYAQIVGLFPDVEAHCRYWTEVDHDAVYNNYPHTFEGVRQYIRESNKSSEAKEACLAYVERSVTNRKNQLAEGSKNPVGGWPVKHVFAHVIKGTFKKSGAVPVAHSDMSLDMLDFEEGFDVFK
jgi:predicted phosphoadenosine phosphosulfate sulfurtransferase